MLYKYLSADRVDVIDNLEIRFSQPRALNDPFESLPLIDATADKKAFIKQVELDVKDLWDKTSDADKTPENYQLLLEQIENVRADVKEKMCPSNIGIELMNIMNPHLGVLSLSRTFTNLLMWSHYADSHKGFVVGLDDSHEFFHQLTYEGLSSRPNNVHYTSQRSMTCVKEPDYYEKLLCEKSIDWAYEEEVRIFSTFMDLTHFDSLDSAGYPVFLIDLPKDAIKSIYIGSHAQEDLKRNLLESIKKNSLDVQLYDTRISKVRYELELISIVQE